MRTILILGALVLSGAVSAQLAVPPGQDIQMDGSRDISSGVAGGSPNASVPGYGTPHSSRNAPAADETTGQAPRFDDRWPTGTPSPTVSPMPGAATPDRGSRKTMNPEDSKTGMDE